MNGYGADPDWLNSMLVQSQGVDLKPQQLFQPGAFDRMSSQLERSRHFAPFDSGEYATSDSTLDSMVHAYQSAGNPEENVQPWEAGRDFIGPLDEHRTWGGDIRPILVCGPPRSGKTWTVRNILYRYSIRLDCLYFATKTQETIPWFEGGMMRQYISDDVDPDMMMALIQLVRKHNQETQQKKLIAVVIDDILLQRDDCKAHVKWLNEFVKSAHREGILLIVACHSAELVWSGGRHNFNIKIQCGIPEDAGTQIKEYWDNFGRSRWARYEDFLDVYKSCINDRGQCFVLQNTTDHTAVSYWHPSPPEPAIYGHRDLWLATYMLTNPVRHYVETVDENGQPLIRWPYCGPNVTSRSMGPGFDMLRKQQAGIDVEKEMSKLIAIEPPSASAKKTRAKRTTALKRFQL